jgi:CRP/FNR family transcriptional regulator, cyclic AMP receptor protein
MLTLVTAMLTPTEIDLIARLLRGGDAFQGMPLAIAQRIAALMQVRAYKMGEKLTQEGGENAGHLMIVLSGEAEISSMHGKEGGHLVHRLAQPGHIIGEVGFIDGQPHSATCEAVGDLHAAILSRDHFIQMFDADVMSASQLMAGLLRLLAKRIRHANHYMLSQDEQLLQLQTEMLSQQKAVPLR